jgi:tetratricopeptide (TPR) repeat protein
VIVSTTLAGPGAERTIVDALRSCAAHVDHHLIALSGCDGDRVVQLASELNQELVFRDVPWPGDYGAARTYMLRWAEERGATWALTLDCDERLELDERDVLALRDPALESYAAATVADRDTHYQKPRFLRCGRGLRWEWPCAERLVGSDGKAPPMFRLPGAFWELPKDAAAERRRAERGVANMPSILFKGENAHARRHLAECLLTLGRDTEARHHFVRVAANSQAPLFERTWCDYRLAEFACVDGDYREALDIAGAALARDPGLIQELGWVMAHANAQLKDFTAAALWCSYVLNAPMDMARGGHRGSTWKKGATDLLASIERAASAGPPERMEAKHFEARREQFTEEYAKLAQAIASIVMVSSSLDLGAGNGLLVESLRFFGVMARGIESANAEAMQHTPLWLREYIAFGVPLEEWGRSARHDLVTCVEVGEHIEASRADELVDACCAVSRRWVYFSAAQPGQGGIGHVNEQPREYWKAKFLARGWTLDADATQALVDKLSGLTRCWWLARNAMIFRKS